MNRHNQSSKLLTSRGLLLLFAFAIGETCLAAEVTFYPTIQLQCGIGESLDGRILYKRDDKSITLHSRQELGYQKTRFEIQIPIPSQRPAEIDAARVAIALHGEKAHPVDAWVFLPKSFVWQRLDTEYLPKDKAKGGFLIYNLPSPERTVVGEHVSLRIEVKDDNRPAKPFTLHMDAVALDVAELITEVDEHAAAMRESGQQNVYVRVHTFAGKTSGNYDKHIDRIWRSWRRLFGESAKTILERKKGKKKAPIYDPSPYGAYGNSNR